MHSDEGRMFQFLMWHAHDRNGRRISATRRALTERRHRAAAGRVATGMGARRAGGSPNENIWVYFAFALRALMPINCTSHEH